MKLELDVYSGICATKVFKVNSIRATSRDFGEKYDTAPDKARPHFCSNMVFKPIAATERVLEKYGITVDEYKYICEQLKEKVSFGACRMCG